MRLYRPDAALITFFSYIGGSELAGGTGLQDLLAAAAVTLFSVNFIYSLNSWADRDMDRVSRPDRPLPAGRLKPDHALLYCILLLILSLVYPFFIFSSPLPILLCLLLPVLGLLYSLKPLRMRNKPYASLAVICIGLILPMLTGYFSNSTDGSRIRLFMVILAYCFGVVPLKKIEETEEDRVSGNVNLYAVHGGTLLSYSSLVIFLTLAVAMAMPFTPVEKTVSFVLLISTLMLIQIFRIFHLPLKRLYQTLIRMVILESILFVVYIKAVS
jgi:4-hydroxybenzoate polyprenyltransferase